MSVTEAKSPSRRPRLQAIFVDHPASVDETYFEHLRFAAWFAGRLALAAAAAVVHALIPALCETTASGTIRELHARIENRGAQPG